ncbi:hypothetical protein [Chromobacterium haemolyticum]|uniref:hypothetical protein n=1 Tax=Chromobacterium haemolyticum TaxID=394935 RepID=UPI002446FE73|nr:hypothetical protein [Chromobacterium haemolyticum]MDH0341968.1 hypothetical protein [Chromobacterium haemolyticum]
MPKAVGKSWERYGRRFSLRLSLKRLEEVAIMNEYDRRSELLGKEDKEFLKSCLVAGFKVLTNKDFCSNELASLSNESNNTPKEHSVTVLPNGSREETAATVDTPPPAPSTIAKPAPELSRQGSGVPAKGVLGGLMKHG